MERRTPALAVKDHGSVKPTAEQVSSSESCLRRQQLFHHSIFRTVFIFLFSVFPKRELCSSDNHTANRDLLNHKDLF